MAARDYETRVLVARIAAHRRWAKSTTADRTEGAQRGQRGLRARLQREIDPDGTLAKRDPAGLERRGMTALQAHMSELSLISKRKRSKRAAVQAA
jgi:hypothetical protein